MDIVLADPDDLHYVDPVTGKTKMRSPSQLPKRARNALKKIQNNRGVVNYEFNGKTEAARILGAWNGWEADKNVNIKGGDGNKVGELRIGFEDNENSEEQNNLNCKIRYSSYGETLLLEQYGYKL